VGGSPTLKTTHPDPDDEDQDLREWLDILDDCPASYVYWHGVCYRKDGSVVPYYDIDWMEWFKDGYYDVHGMDVFAVDKSDHYESCGYSSNDQLNGSHGEATNSDDVKTRTKGVLTSLYLTHAISHLVTSLIQGRSRRNMKVPRCTVRRLTWRLVIIMSSTR